MIDPSEDRAARLTAFLDAVSLRPLVWGVDDCLTGFLAAWILSERGIDPAEGWRGRVHGRIGAALTISRAGGLVAFVSAAAERIGLEPTQAPALGDIGVVTALTEDGLGYLGAICVGGQWALRAPGGLFFSACKPVAAWAV